MNVGCRPNRMCGTSARGHACSSVSSPTARDREQRVSFVLRVAIAAPLESPGEHDDRDERERIDDDRQVDDELGPEIERIAVRERKEIRKRQRESLRCI